MEYSYVGPRWWSFSFHFLWCTSQRWLYISHLVTSGHDHYILNCLIGWKMSGNSTLFYTRSSNIKVIMGKHVRNEWEWHGHDMKCYMSKNVWCQTSPMFGGRPILWQENSNGLSHVKRKTTPTMGERELLHTSVPLIHHEQKLWNSMLFKGYFL